MIITLVAVPKMMSTGPIVFQQPASGFYDVTIESNTTLINIEDDVPVPDGRAEPVNMGLLLAGNAANDPRPGVELASIINALDASILVAAFGTDDDPATIDPLNKRFDAKADFNRDGAVNQQDLDLLTQNYLLFSPSQS